MEDLLDIKSIAPREVCNHLESGATPLYAFVFALTECARNLYNKMVSSGFYRSIHIEEAIVYIYSSLSDGFADAGKCISMLELLDEEKESSLLNWRINVGSITEDDADPMPYLVVDMIEDIYLAALSANDKDCDGKSDANKFKGIAVMLLHVNVSNCYSNFSAIGNMYEANSVYLAMKNGNKYSKISEMCPKIAEKEMFDLFKRNLNDAKSRILRMNKS